MERRLGRRARTDIEVRTRDGSLVTHCRGIEISASGIVLDRGRAVRAGDHRLYIDVVIRLPEHFRRIQARARPVWASGQQQAFKLLGMNDADRLDLAEHVDNMALRGAALT